MQSRPFSRTGVYLDEPLAESSAEFNALCLSALNDHNSIIQHRSIGLVLFGKDYALRLSTFNNCGEQTVQKSPGPGLTSQPH
jgi:hypothetical protein